MSYEDYENQNDDLIEEEHIEDSNSKKVVRLIALITALCLLIVIISPIFKNLNLPSLNFLKESFKLTQKPDVKRYQKAITTITVDSRKGTGFNIDENGLIVTNAHVVKDAESVSVNFYKGEHFKGKVWKLFQDLDLALIKIEGKDLPKIELSQEMKIKKNDEILIIGNPLNYNGVANKGTIYGRASVKNLNKPILLIKAPVNKGNSGSPVINEKGEAVGVIFGTIESDKFNNGKVGAAIPIKYLKSKLDGYKK